MFRPSLETLEKRDLLSAAPLAFLHPLAISGCTEHLASGESSFTAINIEYMCPKHDTAGATMGGLVNRRGGSGDNFYAEKNQDIEVENDETHFANALRNGSSYPNINALNAAHWLCDNSNDVIFLLRAHQSVMQHEGVYWYDLFRKASGLRTETVDHDETITIGQGRYTNPTDLNPTDLNWSFG